MITQTIDHVSFRLNEAHDFSFIHQYGEVFCAFDGTGSGCIGFGVADGKKRYFVKIAGAKTIKPYIGISEAIETLRESAYIYRELKHPCLIELLDCYEMDDLYVAVFKWAEGECLFDHWNFDKYAKNQELLPPRERFKGLPVEKKIKAFDVIFDFLSNAAAKGFVAVDFYDGSVLYDCSSDTTTICDIDFFRKMPAVNDMGQDFFGTKRLKAPEEYMYGESIDEVTNVFTVGALLFHYFGDYTEDEIGLMYRNSRFTPCKPDHWTLAESAYHAVVKAVQQDRSQRYQLLEDFFSAWKDSLRRG